MEGSVYIFKKEIVILEIEQKSKIQQNAGDKPYPHSQFGVRKLHNIAKHIVSQNTDNDNGKIILIKISVKPQRHACQKKVWQAHML